MKISIHTINNEKISNKIKKIITYRIYKTRGVNICSLHSMKVGQCEIYTFPTSNNYKRNEEILKRFINKNIIDIQQANKYILITTIHKHTKQTISCLFPADTIYINNNHIIIYPKESIETIVDIW